MSISEPLRVPSAERSTSRLRRLARSTTSASPLSQARAIDDQRFSALPTDELAKVIEGALLGMLDITEQGAGHAHQGLAGVEAESTQRADPEHTPQALLAGGRRKGLGRDRRHRWSRNFGRPQLLPTVPILGHQDFSRPEPREVLGEGFAIGTSQTLEGTGADFDPSQG
jgi:hypothetical protein